MSDDLSDNLLSDIRRLVYGMKLHHMTPKEGIINRDLELARRLYWEAFAIDK